METKYKFSLGDKVWWATYGLKVVVGCAPAVGISGISYLLEDINGFECKEGDIRSWQISGYPIADTSILVGARYTWVEEFDLNLISVAGTLRAVVEEIKKEIYG